jgi:hypothetical protein
MKPHVPFAAALEAALPKTTAAISRVLLEHAEMAALLRDYAEKSRAVVGPSPVSLIGRTRALLARIEAAP